jgi:hypothetical protein
MENYDSEWHPEDENEEEEDDTYPVEDEDETVEEALAAEEELLEMEEELLVREALLEFSFKFSEYIREMDPELWKRGIDYAVTFTEVEGVEFFTEVNGNTGNSEEPPEPPTT